MSPNLERIRRHWESKPSEELRRLLEEHDTAEYRSETFDVIRNILRERDEAPEEETQHIQIQHTNYEYKMVQIPPTVSVSAGQEGTEAAEYLQTLTNEEAQSGWEFFRVDPVGVRTKPGCLGGLLGQKETGQTYYVVTFRRQLR